MKKMKKGLALLLVAVLALALTACGNGKEETAPTNAPSSAATADTEKTAANGKTLVVYYSATGSTEAVAKTVAETLSADLFEIVPEQPYTADDLNWNDSDSRVSVEHDDETKRKVSLQKSTPDNWEQYTTVYVGYPMWWGIAAWPVDGFVEANDFSGKTVIPFCTSASSGLGSSAERLRAAAGGGSWQEGKRFSSGVKAETVAVWARETAE